METYKTIEIVQKNPTSPVFHLYLSGPSFRNALPRDFFSEFPKALASLDQNPDAAVIILAGNGGHFCTGIDLKALSSTSSQADSDDSGRTNERLRRDIKFLQAAVTAIEQCRKPVIAAIHGGCIGAGVDIVTACDIRYCSQDAFFSVKEVDLAITADLGTLQRLPGIVGYGHAMELALTARTFKAAEAKALGLVSRVFGSKQEMDEGVRVVAEDSHTDESPASSILAELTTKMIVILSKTSALIQTTDTATAPIGIKLDDTNYALWSQVVEMYISSKDKLGYINGDLSQPPPTDSTFR